MRRWHRKIALVLLLLWGVVTVHCGLELDGLLGSEKHASTSTDLDDADVDGCVAIESGYFAADADFLALAQPFFAVAFVLPEVEETVPATRSVAGICHGLAPPELLPSWSFTRRASPPSRAPDSVS